MGKRYRIILIISIVVSEILLRYEWVHDKPSPPYTLMQTITETAIAGSIVTAFLFTILSGVYFILNKVARKQSPRKSNNILFALLLFIQPYHVFSQTQSDHENAMEKFKNFYNDAQPDSICNMFSDIWGKSKKSLFTKKEINKLQNEYGKIISYKFAGIDSVTDKNKIRLFITTYTKSIQVTGFVIDNKNKFETFRFSTSSPHIDSVFYQIQKVNLKHES